MKRYLLIIVSIIFTFIFSSCNWDTLSSGFDDVISSGSTNTVSLFRGDAPRNVSSTQAIYSDRVAVSFDSVAGADSYDIERVSIASGAESYSDDDWRIIATVTADSRDRYTYQDLTAISPDTVYFYRVRGRSLYAEIQGGTEAKYSDVVSGWPLSAPTTLTASQGTYSDTILLEWSQIDMVSGYDVYYYIPSASGVETWTKANSTQIPAPYGAETISMSFTPTQNQRGVDIFFRVQSISRGGNYSGWSSVRNGYTYVPGAPNKPADLTASEADSTQHIDISWEIPSQQNDPDDTESYYRWEIYRTVGSEEQILLYSFTATTDGGPVSDRIKEEDGHYVYTDTSSSDNVLQAGVEYDYTVRAILVRPTLGDELTGISGSCTGYLVGPPTNITNMYTSYPTDSSNGYFEFTIAEPPKGWDRTKNWVYNVYGRKSMAGELPGSWILIEGNIPVTAAEILVHVDYDQTGTSGYNVNEFDIRVVVADEGIESAGYESINSSAIVTPRAEAPSATMITISQNQWSADLTANGNGVYPVKLSLGSSSLYEKYQIEALDADNVSQGTIGELVNNNPEIILTDLSPEKAGDVWYYRIRGVDVFGRYSEWSSNSTSQSDRYASGYGALTGHAFIKFFEMYAMKPWEFVNNPDMPQNLKTKWNKSTIHSLIDKHGLGSLGEVTEYSDYHDGSIYYHSYASGFAGDVDFVYTNFGELESIYSNGSYKMDNVNASGNNGSCSGTITVSGMYPAVIDFSSLGVTGYAFSGNYIVTQDNGRGQENVEATRNE